MTLSLKNPLVTICCLRLSIIPNSIEAKPTSFFLSHYGTHANEIQNEFEKRRLDDVKKVTDLMTKLSADGITEAEYIFAGRPEELKKMVRSTSKTSSPQNFTPILQQRSHSAKHERTPMELSEKELKAIKQKEIEKNQRLKKLKEMTEAKLDEKKQIQTVKMQRIHEMIKEQQASQQAGIEQLAKKLSLREEKASEIVQRQLSSISQSIRQKREAKLSKAQMLQSQLLESFEKRNDEKLLAWSRPRSQVVRVPRSDTADLITRHKNILSQMCQKEEKSVQELQKTLDVRQKKAEKVRNTFIEKRIDSINDKLLKRDQKLKQLHEYQIEDARTKDEKKQDKTSKEQEQVQKPLKLDPNVIKRALRAEMAKRKLAADELKRCLKAAEMGLL